MVVAVPDGLAVTMLAAASDCGCAVAGALEDGELVRFPPGYWTSWVVAFAAVSWLAGSEVL